MDEKPDRQLLHDYARHGDEAAFREIVARYTDLVYSAAARQVETPHTAADITQTVFVDLARKAATLSAGTWATTSLAGWLHRATRYLALNHRRDSHRRVALERQAMEQVHPTPDTAPDWEQLRPALDDAMSELDDSERDALLLRYFKNHDLRTVGATLGISDDAAQKRVSRAVERLREFFAKRGVTVGASGLAVVISANAVQAAPVGLALTISTAAVLTGTTLATATTITATKAIAMTSLQKTIVTATIAVLAGAGIYEARQASQLREQVQTLQQQQAQPSVELVSLRKENQQLAKLKIDADELTRLRNERNELLRLRGEVGQLRRQLADYNQRKTANSSADATTASLAPTTEAEFDTAKRQMSFVMERVQSALRQFVTNNPYGVLKDTNGQPNPDLFANFPGLPLDNLELKARDVQGLANALDQKSKLILAASKEPIVYNGMWTRFYLLADGSVRSETSYNDTPREHVYPSDEDLDAARAAASRDGKVPDNLRNIVTTLDPVMKAFSAVNDGKGPTDPAQLAPYVTTPGQQAALQQLLQMKQNARSNNPAQ